jgi:hypothetical protein
MASTAQQHRPNIVFSRIDSPGVDPSLDPRSFFERVAAPRF